MLYDFGPRQYDPFIWRTTSQDPHAESYYAWSPYSWAFNNPIRYDDPTGNDPGDKVLGFAAALIDNAFGGMTNTRSVAAHYVDDPADFNMGQDMGDVSSMVVGVMMVEGGTGAAIGGGAVSVSGVGAVVGAPVAGGGLLVAAEGAVLGVSGAASFGSQKGRLNGEAKSKSHGNKLDDNPAEGYTLKDKKTGDTKKYGETTRGEDKFGQGNQKRYSKKELNEKGVEYKKEVSGTKKEMHQWQNKKIVEHKNQNNGKRPDLNKSDY